MSSTRKSIVRRVMAPKSVTSLIKSKNAGVAGVTRVRRAKYVDKQSQGQVVTVWLPDEHVVSLLKEAHQEVREFRAGEYIHVSDLIGKCIRKMALSDKHTQPMPGERISDSLAITFAQGNVAHDYVKDKIKKGHPEKLYGTWSCSCGATKHTASILSEAKPVPCKSCGTSSTHKYVELELLDEEYLISGSPDVVLYLQKVKAFYPVEIKSISAKEWDELVRPKPDHVIQILFYWYLMRKAGYNVTSSVSILYVNKGYVFKSPYKEFVLEPEPIIGRLDDYLEDAKARADYIKYGTVPRRIMCSTIGVGPSKSCHLAVQCFQDE